MSHDAKTLVHPEVHEGLECFTGEEWGVLRIGGTAFSRPLAIAAGAITPLAASPTFGPATIRAPTGAAHHALGSFTGRNLVAGHAVKEFVDEVVLGGLTLLNVRAQRFDTLVEHGNLVLLEVDFGVKLCHQGGSEFGLGGLGRGGVLGFHGFAEHTDLIEDDRAGLEFFESQGGKVGIARRENLAHARSQPKHDPVRHLRIGLAELVDAMGHSREFLSRERHHAVALGIGQRAVAIGSATIAPVGPASFGPARFGATKLGAFNHAIVATVASAIAHAAATEAFEPIAAEGAMCDFDHAQRFETTFALIDFRGGLAERLGEMLNLVGAGAQTLGQFLVGYGVGASVQRGPAFGAARACHSWGGNRLALGERGVSAGGAEPGDKGHHQA